MAVSRRVKSIYMNFFDGIETACANLISNVQETHARNKNMPKEPVPKELRLQVKKYWKQYGVHISSKWAWYYAARNGIVDPRYIPNTLAYARIDQYFNDRKLGYGFNDKNYYDKIFSGGGGIKLPITLVRKIKGMLFDADYHQISMDKALCILAEEEEVICKPSLESGSGRGITFWHTERDKELMRRFLDDQSEADYIIQKLIKQHADLNRIHANSINSVRIMSILCADGVHILSSCLRMGTNESRIDNVTAGGISCGIHEDGKIDDYAYTYYTGERSIKHPQGFVFSGFCVPSYDKAVELVMKAHPMIAHFRLVSWDIAIDENGDAVLIEANMRKGGINLQQFDNGPMFNDLTDRILKEVYRGR